MQQQNGGLDKIPLRPAKTSAIIPADQKPKNMRLAKYITALALATLAFVPACTDTAEKPEKFIGRVYTFEDVERYVQVGTPKGKVVLHFGKPLIKHKNKDGSESWQYFIERRLLPERPKVRTFNGFSLHIEDGKVVVVGQGHILPYSDNPPTIQPAPTPNN